MDENSLRLLEFNKILEEIAFHASSPATERLILSIRPFTDKDAIEKRFRLVNEIRKVLSEEKVLSLDDFDDLSGIFQKIKPEGSFLDGKDLYTLRNVFMNIKRIKDLIEKRKDVRELLNFVSGMEDFEELIDLIDRSVDGEGNILDSASYELKEIRKKKREIENKIRKRLDEIIHDRQLSSALQDEYITLRSGRWVIPLKANFKGRIPGVIHDISRTGETLYVEPLEIIEFANEHENIIAEERAEEIRVLKTISYYLRKDLLKITASYELLLYFDLLKSIALFSERLSLTEPEINREIKLRLIKARHPILLILKEKGLIDEVVPLDLELGDPHRIMVITGPNAGGKTIALKTAGLLTVMALSGIPVSADSDSVIPIFRDILVDMGDEQSIEESLSTFSSHIKNITAIFQKADSETLVLLDELGRATNPSEGSALSCAILNELKEKGSMVISTTHLLDITAFVHRTEGMLNASMEFDESLMRPLYRLKTGIPGQSYGIYIADRFGLPQKVIESAKVFLGKGILDFQLMLKDLKEKQLFYEQEIERLKDLEGKIFEKERHLKEKEEELERKRQDIIMNALEEADKLLKETKVFINKLLMESKKNPKESIKKIREKEADIQASLSKFSKAEGVFIPEPGSTVYIKSLGYDGVVTRVESDRVRVRAGPFEAEVLLSDIGEPKGISIRDQEKRTPEESVSESINVTGMTVDEALLKLESYLNHAFLANLNEVKVIHGHGTGRLKKAIRAYLKNHLLTESFRPGRDEEGGDGVTVVRIK